MDRSLKINILAVLSYSGFDLNIVALRTGNSVYHMHDINYLQWAALKCLEFIAKSRKPHFN